MTILPAFPLALLLAAAIAGLGFWWLIAPRRTSPHAGAAEALHVCRLFLDLLRNMQQHRGMSSAWLSGDTSFGLRMQERRGEIARLLDQLATALQAEQQRPCPNPERAAFERFRNDWQELASGLSGCTVEQSIARHGALIGSLLDWLSGFGEARLALHAHQTRHAQVRNFTHRLPALTEALGQARAIGSSVAARKGCSPVPRVRLMFLVARAEALIEQAGAVSCDGNARNACEQARRSIAETARVVREQLLRSAGVGVSADDYFALATRGIDTVFAWIDACGNDVARQTKARDVGGSTAFHTLRTPDMAHART